MDTQRQQKISLSLPADTLARIEAERERLTAQLGARISFNAAATSLLHRALSQNDLSPAAG
ncbi:hypothetical protein [Ralstonia pseudosolanacearum]|uniref:hypothetical protein n=1 Tax=Ralstonia pseudosolanacearum TaxID=1310165 RepID=UPI0012DB0AF2|nr:MULTISPECIES: hypothetical protein [Ralstonia]UZF36217.1 hypothetical protein LGV81_06055 [Ralstonia sp. RS647]